ncbi:hypothetical protein NXS98_07520 [Fontisphaera persica]|uniref:hypothetical protein n=1 Tax=Fontisphaera persica TaxID=2974023 RepID=UPI0024BF9F2F|nr:hypothetical protein [Fontisphaera persica]WCJ60959.1 hypothetical protein NXS98_07520 [Fontisphaera persica]
MSKQTSNSVFVMTNMAFVIFEWNLNIYGFIRNDPIRKHDYLGLSERDVHNIVTNFLRGVMEMCEEEYRCDNRFKNNLLSYSPWHKNYACNDQADWMATRLACQKYDASWTFSIVGREDLPHTWVVLPGNFSISLAHGIRSPHYWGKQYPMTRMIP